MAFAELIIKEQSRLLRVTTVVITDWINLYKDNYEFTYSKCGLCELGKREGSLWLSQSELRPVAETESSVKVYGDDQI